LAYAKEIYLCHAHFELTVIGELSTDYIIVRILYSVFSEKILNRFLSLNLFQDYFKSFLGQGLSSLFIVSKKLL
jgi:hypothetical protein